MATRGCTWLSVVNVLTRNSGPRGAPPTVNRWPKTPDSDPSWSLAHTTTKFPLSSMATLGSAWYPVV